KSQFGYHIIKAGNRAEAGYLSLEQARAEVESNLLASKKQQAFTGYLEKLKQEADIKDYRK
ncbi:MAG: peptidylprolyl isomerase, partial [Syntrophomonadaceae bacterium]|nr:peptidylprolyl isomerase [Syntrophomonadaceae bacterium]